MSFKPIGLELSSVLAEWVENRAAQEPIVFAVWRRVVGEAVTTRSSPRAFSKGVLIIDVIDSTWGTALEGMTPEILGKLNGALGKRVVRVIEWRLAP
jgi:predicted nucleic acid-binding Zn ribbon protein